MQSSRSVWLHVDASKHKIKTFSLLPFNRLPVNTIDIESRTLLYRTDGEAMIIVREIPIKQAVNLTMFYVICVSFELSITSCTFVRAMAVIQVSQISSLFGDLAVVI